MLISLVNNIAGLQFEYIYQKPALKTGMDFIGL